MITDRIKALFNFIEFLHSNIDNFKRYDILINELYSLDIERNNVKPQNNFADKLKYDEVQAIIKDKFNVIQSNIILPIQDKSNELNICDWNKTETLWNYNILEINELKENFSKNDLPEILKYKNKYIEFRTVTNCNYFQSFFFNDLDKILKVLFDFFKETTDNEFEVFETKTIEVNSIEEAIQILTAKESKVQNKIWTVEDYRKHFFETGNIAFPMDCPDLIPEYYELSLNSFFEEKKELLNTMFIEEEQRKMFISNEKARTKFMIEKCNETLRKLPFFNTEINYKKITILQSYISFLENKLSEQPQRNKASKPKKLKKTLLEFIHNVEKKEAFIQDLKNTFPTEIGKSIKAIINILIEAKILIIPDREFKAFYDLLNNEFNQYIGSYSSINDADKLKPFDDKFLEPIQLKLNPLIIKYKST